MSEPSMSDEEESGYNSRDYSDSESNPDSQPGDDNNDSGDESTDNYDSEGDNQVGNNENSEGQAADDDNDDGEDPSLPQESDSVDSESSSLPPPPHPLAYLNHERPDVIFAPVKLLASHGVITNEDDSALIKSLADTWEKGEGLSNYIAQYKAIVHAARKAIGIPKRAREKLSLDAYIGTDSSKPIFKLLDAVSYDKVGQGTGEHHMVDASTLLGPESTEDGTTSLTIYVVSFNSAIYADELIDKVGKPHKHVGMHVPLSNSTRSFTAGLSVFTDQQQYRSLVACICESVGDKCIVHYLLLLFGEENTLDLVVHISRLSPSCDPYFHIQEVNFVQRVPVPKSRVNVGDRGDFTASTANSRWPTGTSLGQKPGIFSTTSDNPHGKPGKRARLFAYQEEERKLRVDMAKEIKKEETDEKKYPYSESASFPVKLARIRKIQLAIIAIEDKFNVEFDKIAARKTAIEEEKPAPGEEEEELDPAPTGFGGGPIVTYSPDGKTANISDGTIQYTTVRRITTVPNLFVQTNANFFTKWVRKLGNKAKNKLGFGATARSAIPLKLLERGARIAAIPDDSTTKFRTAADFFSSKSAAERRADSIPVTVKYFSVGSTNALVDQRDKKDVAAFLVTAPEDSDENYAYLDMDLSKGFTLRLGKKQDTVEVAVKDVADRAFAGFEGKFVVTPETLKEAEGGNAIAFLTSNIAVLFKLTGNGAITDMMFVNATPGSKRA